MGKIHSEAQVGQDFRDRPLKQMEIIRIIDKAI